MMTMLQHTQSTECIHFHFTFINLVCEIKKILFTVIVNISIKKVNRVLVMIIICSVNCELVYLQQHIHISSGNINRKVDVDIPSKHELKMMRSFSIYIGIFEGLITGELHYIYFS